MLSSADSSSWSTDIPEADDDLRGPDPRRDVLGGSEIMFALCGPINLGRLALLLLGIVALLYVLLLIFAAATP